MLKTAKLIEAVLKISGLLAVFGYMSLRSHLNFLGISAMSPLSLQQYLVEAYHWLVITVPPVAMATFWIGAFWQLAAVLWRRFRPRPFQADSTPWWRGDRMAITVLGILVGTLLVFNYCKAGAWKDTDLLVGKIDPAAFPSPAQLRLQTRLYFGVSAICLWSYCFLAATSLRGGSMPRARRRGIRVLSYGAVGLLALLLPLQFGKYIHSNSYPLVEIAGKEGATSLPQKGYLILQSADFTVLWTCTGAEGRTVIIPKDQVTRMQATVVEDVVQRALASAQSPPRSP